MYKEIENCNLFEGLSVEKIEALLCEVGFKEKYFTKGDIIATHDSEVREMLIVVEGSVKGEMTDMSGKTIKIEDIESPRMLAPAFWFGQNNRFPVDIVANENTTIIALSRPAFTQLMQSNEKILINYLNSISSRSQFLTDKIRFLSFQTLQGKIAHYLLQESKRYNSAKFRLTKSQAELSEMFGVARPSLGRTMRELHELGILNAAGKDIEIVNKKELTKLMNI